MPEDKKITALPAATLPLAGTEKAEIVQGGVNKQVSVSEVGGSYPNGLAVVAATGTAISFAIPQAYASAASPATGNITLVTTGLVAGMVQTLFHNDSSEPTFPAQFVRISGFYIPNTLNMIYMHAISATRIEYMIFQEL